MSEGETAFNRHVENRGPSVLVQSFIFCDDHILLMRRGQPPYAGQWSPPGGFVEPYESPEAAAIRETQEEVGIQLPVGALLPLATVSVASINQLYIMFMVRLDSRVRPTASPPESLDARWFPRCAFPLPDIWEPMMDFNLSDIFDRAGRSVFRFFQRTDEFHRAISADDTVRYLRAERIVGKLRP